MTIQIHITGKVQGVNFRTWSRDAARSLELTGFVCNNSNSAVTVQVAGKEDAVKQFIEMCKQGPKYAEVKHVKVQEVQDAEEYTDFTIVSSV